MEEIVETVTKASVHSQNNNQNWQENFLLKCHEWHSQMITTGEKWLDRAASVELTNPSPKHVSWTEEVDEFKRFVSLPPLEKYHDALGSAFRDGVQGAQSVAYAIWMLVQPILYSTTYVCWRFAQASFGKLLPKLQYVVVETCRFHLHLTWRQFLGEVATVAFCVAGWKLYKLLQRKAYIRRTRTFFRRQADKATKVRVKSISYSLSIVRCVATKGSGYVGYNRTFVW